MTVPYAFGNTPTGQGIPLSHLDDNFDAVGNSANVSFIQNTLGAVRRTSQSKMSDVISIKDFGAVGDNSADDAPYIQAALNYAGNAGGVEVLVPPGTYKIMSSLQMPSNVTLRGVTSLQGGGASFRFGSAYAFSTPPGSGFHIFNIYNLAIWGTRFTTDFIDQSGGGSWSYSTIANCYIVNFRNFHTITTGNHFLNNNFQNMVSMEFRGGDYSIEDNYIGYDDQETTKGSGDSLLALIASTGVDFSRNYMTSWNPANPANTPIVLDVQNSADIRVVSNWIDGGTSTSMLISVGSQKVVATHNRFGVIFPATCIPIGLSNVTDVTVRDNIVSGLNASAPFISFASTLARCIVADNITNTRTDTTTHDYSSATATSGVTMSGYGLSVKDTSANIDIFPPLYGRTIINQSTTGLAFFYVFSTKFVPGQFVNFSRTNTANRVIVRDADTSTNIYDSNTSGFNTGRVVCYVSGAITVESIA